MHTMQRRVVHKVQLAARACLTHKSEQTAFYSCCAAVQIVRFVFPGILSVVCVVIMTLRPDFSFHATFWRVNRQWPEKSDFCDRNNITLAVICLKVLCAVFLCVSIETCHALLSPVECWLREFGKCSTTY
jgi:hypothetical protein